MAKQLILPLVSVSNYNLEGWVIDAGNAEAFSLVNNWPDWPVPRIVCFYGEASSGKTHLAHILAHKSGGVYVKANQVCNQNPYHLLQRNQVLVLDEVEALFPPENNYEEWLFHLYNIAKEKDAYILFISQNSPINWPVSLPDLNSRLKTIISVAINRPSDQVLSGVFVKLFQERGVSVKSEVVEYLLKHSERSFGAINSLASQLDRISLERGRPITIPLIREVLQSG